MYQAECVTESEGRSVAEIVLVNPRHEVSYWGLEYSLPLLRKRAVAPPVSLPLLASLTPPEHHVTIIDENVEPLDFDRLAQANIVGLTGMNTQRARMRQILGELKRRGVFTVVGGPFVSVREEYFGDLVDAVFVGEAEESWPRFLVEWQQGRHKRRNEQAEHTDMSRVPTPRYDLLRMSQYLLGSVQFSRGCPNQCEFCDIIVIFGRRPRLKTTVQVVAELDALRAQGLNSAFIVDDNLIGSPRAIKPLLREVAAWQQAHHYPLTFFAQTSLDLAEADELKELLVEANIQAVFIGIESPDQESLREIKKLHNLSDGRTLVERVRRVQDSGFEVWAGMIVGFDHDDGCVFKRQREFLQDARINQAFVGLLYAPPKTALYARLEAEGRIDVCDELKYGTNVIPLRMSRDALRDGYLRLMQDLYDPQSFFDRVEDLYLAGGLGLRRGRRQYWRWHPWVWLKGQATNLIRCAVLYWRLMRGVDDAQLRATYRRRMWRLLRRRPDPVLLLAFLLRCTAHFHFYAMTQQMTGTRMASVNPFY